MGVLFRILVEPGQQVGGVVGQGDLVPQNQAAVRRFGYGYVGLDPLKTYRHEPHSFIRSNRMFKFLYLLLPDLGW
jgi:hypothetical protein